MAARLVKTADGSFDLTSTLNHSCEPNCVVSYVDGCHMASVTAIQPLAVSWPIATVVFAGPIVIRLPDLNCVQACETEATVRAMRQQSDSLLFHRLGMNF